MSEIILIQIFLSYEDATSPPFSSNHIQPFLSSLIHSQLLRSPFIAQTWFMKSCSEKERFMFWLVISYWPLEAVLEEFLWLLWLLYLPPSFTDLFWRLFTFYVVAEMNIWRFSSLHLWSWWFTIWSILKIPMSVSTTSQTATNEYAGSRFISKLLSDVWTARGVSLYLLVLFQIAHLMSSYLTVFASTIVHLSSTCEKVYIVHV